MSKIILIIGPTATGKTALSIALAKKLNAEIINADSTQIYKEANIATAKITEEEKEGIKHHLIDIKNLGEEYTIYDFQKDGRKIIDDLLSKNINIVIVGGSALYVKALLYDYKLDKEEKDDIDLSNYTNQELKDMADKIDINNNIHINNRHRLERYIKYYKKTGKTITKTDSINNKIYDFEVIGLNAPRDEIYNRCDKRVDEMFDSGLLEEAKSIYNKHYKNYTSIIGYRELDKYFKGEISLDEAKELMKKNTRHFAKRQITFYNHQFNDIKWFNTNYKDFNKTIDEVFKYLDI